MHAPLVGVLCSRTAGCSTGCTAAALCGSTMAGEGGGRTGLVAAAAPGATAALLGMMFSFRPAGKGEGRPVNGRHGFLWVQVRNC